MGFVKTNIGHSEAASGLSSIIKVTLTLENRCIPPSIGIESINPELKSQERNIHVVRKCTDWPASQAPRASVNSFGFGGSNAHVILESAHAHLQSQNEPAAVNGNNMKPSVLLLHFSAHSKESLFRRVSDLQADIKIKRLSLEKLAFTLGCRRSKMSQRGYLVVNSITWKQDINTGRLRTATSRQEQILPTAFVFTGQGAQWPGLGRELAQHFPCFRLRIQMLDKVLSQIPEAPDWLLEGPWMLMLCLLRNILISGEDLIRQPTEESKIHHASRSQAVYTAVQIALVDLFRSWRIRCSAVIGHSSGGYPPVRLFFHASGKMP